MTDNYTVTTSDFNRQNKLWRLRNNVLREALSIHLDHLDPNRALGAVSGHEQPFDDAVLELAKALQPVPSFIVKVEGDIDEETASHIRQSLDWVMRRYG